MTPGGCLGGVLGGFRSFLSNWGVLYGKKNGFTKFGVDLDGPI